MGIFRKTALILVLSAFAAAAPGLVFANSGKAKAKPAGKGKAAAKITAKGALPGKAKAWKTIDQLANEAIAERTYQCVQGKTSDLRIVHAFERATDPLVRLFRQKKREREERGGVGFRTIASLDESTNRTRATEQATPHWIPCARVDEQLRTLQKNIEFAQRAIQPAVRPRTPPPTSGPLVRSRIRLSCIDASLRRASRTDAYYCESESGAPHLANSPGAQGPCVSSEMAEYLQFALTQAIECLSQPGDPLDPRVFLKKVNNESFFHFYQGYPGGIGFGQMTPIAIRQLVEEDPGFMLRRVVHSPNKACEAFRPIVEQDLKAGRTRVPTTTGNYCYWLAADRGVARNMIFATALYAYYRDQLRFDKKDGNPNLRGEVLDYLALASFGPGGPRSGFAIVKTKPKSVHDVIRHSAYLQNTQETWDMLKKLVSFGSSPRALASDFRGDACVEPL